MMKFLEQLQKEYSDNEKLALLIRHADRDKIPQGCFGNEIPINDKGKQDAYKFGNKLSEFKINKIYTSPLLRCVQTAEYISKGYGKNLPIFTTTALGAPGLHVKNEQIAGELYLQYGIQPIYQRFVSQENLPGFASPSELRRELSYYLKNSTQDNGITLFISHDLLIAMFHYAWNRTVYDSENWLKFLTGIIIKTS